jgi:hypothetical protein
MKPHWMVAVTTAVVALASTTLAFDTKWHADATRVAMDQEGFSADARLMCQFGNYLTDYFSGAESKYAEHVPAEIPKQSNKFHGVDERDVARLHFDALTSAAQVEQQWSTLESNTRAALVKWAADPSVKSGYRPVVLITILGASLHAVQDFYSHSNWLKRVSSTASPAPIWFEVPAADRAKLDVKTGWYPDGNTPGLLYHRDENKDSTGRLLQAEAFAAASRASSDWVRRIVAATPEVPWATLKAWKAQPANLNGHWLRNADATFVTTTSILADHWDGNTPAKNVFAPEASRNKYMAQQALGLTMRVYTQNIALNGAATPTPHWVGFTMFHVERDLAKGLYLQNIKR